MKKGDKVVVIKESRLTYGWEGIVSEIDEVDGCVIEVQFGEGREYRGGFYEPDELEVIAHAEG